MATIQGIYIALFGRPADPLGLAFFEAETQGGADLTAIGDLAATAEYQARFEGMTSAQIVTAIYQSLFGRNPELAGLEFFVAELESGRQNINTIAINILDGAQGNDALVVANKEAAADLWTAAIAADPDALAAYQGQVGIDAGVAFLAGITADPATVPTEAQVEAAVAALVEGFVSPIGDTFTLTTAVGEIVDGTDANDTFIAVLDDDASQSTLNIGDQLDGKGGTDTLDLFVTGDAELPVASSIKNIEIVNIISAGGTVDNLSAAAFVGAQQIWQINDSADIAGVGAGVTVGFRDHQVSADVTFTGAVGNIALDGVEDGSSIDIEGKITTLNVSGSMEANGDTLNLHDHTDDGDGDVTIETVNLALTTNTVVDMQGEFEAMTTFNASGSTGGITVDLTASADLEVAAFGSGKDDVTIGLGDSDTTVDLGAGADTIEIDASGTGDNVSLTITLGAGSDTVQFAELSDLSNIEDASEDDFMDGIITITDFNAASGGDLLDLTELGLNFATLLNPQLSAIADADSLFDALEIAAGAIGVGEDAVAFDYGGNAYILASVNNEFDDGDGLIQLTGVSVAELGASNFIV